MFIGSFSTFLLWMNRNSYEQLSSVWVLLFCLTVKLFARFFPFFSLFQFLISPSKYRRRWMCVWSCVWKQKEMCNLVRFKRVLSSPLSMPFIGHHWSAIHFDTTLWNYHITTRKCSMFESHGIAHLKWVAVVNRHTEIPFNDFDSFWLCWAAFFTCIIFMEKFLVYMCLETLLPLIVLEYTHARGFLCVSVCMCRSDCSAPVRTIIRSDQSYCKAVQCNCEFECECAQFYLRLSFERSPAGLSMYWSVCTMCVMWKRQNSTLTVTVEQQQRQHHHQKRKKERAKL